MADEDSVNNNDEEMTYEELVDFINRSGYRVKILRCLDDDPKMPRDIAAECNILKNHISNSLTELKNLGLIVCINPEVKKGRIYRLSEEGEDIIDKLI